MARDRFDHRVDHSDDTKPARLQRVEVITGVERRRDWSTDKKLEIVAESLVDGVVVSDVARRHGISPQQLFGWRAKLRSAIAIAASAPTPAETPTFAPVLVNESSSRRIAALEPPGQTDNVPAIEITLGSAVVRVRGAVDARTLAAVLKVLKVLA
jgi:transposase